MFIFFSDQSQVYNKHVGTCKSQWNTITVMQTKTRESSSKINDHPTIFFQLRYKYVLDKHHLGAILLLLCFRFFKIQKCTSNANR